MKERFSDEDIVDFRVTKKSCEEESAKTRQSGEKKARLKIKAQQGQFDQTMAFKKEELEHQIKEKELDRVERQEVRCELRHEKRDK